VISRAPNQASAPANRPRTLAGRIRGSFLSSVGSIVFGMEDGTVSIFGLVFGVAAKCAIPYSAGQYHQSQPRLYRSWIIR